MNPTGLIRTVGSVIEAAWAHQFTPQMAGPCLSWVVLAADAAIKGLDKDALIELAYPCDRGQMPAGDAQDITRLFIGEAPASALLLANAERATSIKLEWTNVSVTFAETEFSDAVTIAFSSGRAREHLNSYLIDICVVFFCKSTKQAKAEFRALREVAS